MKITIDTTAKTVLINELVDVTEFIDFVNKYDLLDYKLTSKDTNPLTFTSPWQIQEHDFDYNDSITENKYKFTV